ncbi:MAG: hypothetical protein RL088_3934 [Verrucomicrobiota bacterium]|jgi:hypothetical protein
MIDPLVFLACSGPGAANAIAKSDSIGDYCAGFAALVTLALYLLCLRRNGKAWPAYAGSFLLLLHPAWTVSSRGGDCGLFKRDASYFVSFVFVAFLVFQLYVSRPNNRNP